MRSGIHEEKDVSKSWVLTVDKNFLQLQAGKARWKCNFTRNGLARPKEIDLMVLPSNDIDGGRTFSGIYECDREKQTLKLCVSVDPNASNRPSTFASQKGDNVIVIEFEKDK